MHRLRLFLPAFLLLYMLGSKAFSQGPIKNYEKEWKNVDAFVKKGLPKSALDEVKKIYSLAKNEKQDAQVIKSLVYIMNLQEENRENNELQSIGELEKETLASKGAANSILNSLLAEVYWGYYQDHRYQFYNRTQTVNFKKDDPATWTAEDFFKKITELYLLSIRDDKLLQQTRLEPFDAIILKGNVRHLRPTLYDLLVHRALSWFENDEQDIKKPAYAFEIDQASAFDQPFEFINRSFPTNDSLSLQHKALLIFQKLIAFHLKDPKPDALIDADILRLEFVRSKSVNPDKDHLYFNGLNRITYNYPDLPAAAEAWYLMAKYYDEQAATYKPYGDSTHRLDRVKAKEICEQVLNQKDSSEGKINCFNLLNSIRQQTLEFSVEKVNLPGQPFRAMVNYRNVGKLWLRIIKPDEALKTSLQNQYDDKYWPAIIAAKSLKSWEQTLPLMNDFQSHGAEIKVDALPAGEYLLMVSNSKDFSDKQALLGARFFYVSSISFINSGDDFFVLDRDNGQPLAGASVQIWTQKFDYTSSKYVKEKGPLYQTDRNGYFRLEKKAAPNITWSPYSYMLDISHHNERFFMNELINDYYSRNDADTGIKITTTIYLFTDRSIYRPGQTVYFKGIVLMRNEKEKRGSVRKDYAANVVLRDANYKDIDTINVRTNEFGSFSGKFQLPETGLNGQFSLYTKRDGGSAGFRVEDYKRPKFYVDYEPVKGTYKVNDKIRLTGIAKAYAGNNVDGAQVKYRVVRQPRFIYSWMFWRWWQPPTEEMEIAHGEIKTDKDGKFIVEFNAIPDLKIDKKFEPVFDYTVYADVTDINGETRSGEKMVSVSYKSLLIRTVIPASMPADSLRSFFIRTENMNGEYEPAKVTVDITKLRDEKRLIRSRLWERPDQFVMTKEEYITNFPNDEYDNESDPKSWAKEQSVFAKTDSALTTGDWPITGGKFAPGYYMVEISTKDKNGDLVKDVAYIQLYNETDNKAPAQQYLWTGKMQTTVEPGESANVELGTAAENIFLIRQIDKAGGLMHSSTPDFSFISLNQEKKSFSFPVTEADRGGYSVEWLFVKNNRFYQSSQIISVPWTNKELHIEYVSFRDKILPGSEEKWKLRLTGYKNEKVAAEMLGAMYDASLDQFYPHGWGEPSIWPTYYNQATWSGSLNFAMVESSQRSVFSPESKYARKQYDELLPESGRARRNYQREDIREAPVMMKLSEESLVNKAITTEVPLLRLPKKDGDGVKDEFDKEKSNTQTPAKPEGEIQVRKNFNETAFFLPDLRTDSSGAIEFSFTIPEALTRWKFMALAHTKDAAFGSSTKEIVTQKQLMVQPNMPRFLREGDKMELSTKIVNLTDKELTGQAQLQLIDATTNESVDGWFQNMIPNQYFTVAAGQSEAVKFPMQVPFLFNKALVWRIVARSGDYSDGEENAMAVLTNRMLVTETMPLPMRGTGTKNFSFDKLLKEGNSESLQHYALTVEYTSNPAWYAVQALPYLMEYPYECAEQTWNRYYANSLASYISGSSPKIKAVFEQWKIKDTAALLSNLQKNQELKAVLLEETPWVLQANNENEQKKNIALLFDMIRMSKELNSAYDKMKQMQSSNGGFVWFKGGPDDRYMTQYIVTGIGHLKKLSAIANDQNAKLKSILASAIPYLDNKIVEDYNDLLKYKTDLKKYVPGYTTIQYLYMRSFFPEYEITKATQTAYQYFRSRIQKTWTVQSKYMQGMIVLALGRTGDNKTPSDILKSLKETSINNEELGMYWKDQSTGGWFWYQAPIETQSLMIEAFQEIGKDTKTVDDLRTWLLKNKQTSNWKTTKATAEACYALLLQGTSWITNEPVVQIKMGNASINSTDNTQEAGTGYFKKTIEGTKVNPEMGNISVTVTSNSNTNSPTWGGIYWQYFEDLDKITTASTPLKLVKKLFVEKNTDRGPVLTPVNEGDILKVGDKIKVRIELRADRDFEYVHMKDMRASALEPVNVLSSYKYQDGLGYYESTRDASTNFFFNYLRKGTYVFEYSLFVTNAGDFSNGVTTIQCMYAPEFSSHSEGVRIKVE